MPNGLTIAVIASITTSVIGTMALSGGWPTDEDKTVRAMGIAARH